MLMLLRNTHLCTNLYPNTQRLLKQKAHDFCGSEFSCDINLQLLWISADQLHLHPPLKHKHEGWSLSWKSLCLFNFIIYKWDPHNPHFLSTVYQWLCWGTKKILDCHNKCICSVISKYVFLALKRSEVAVSKERAKIRQLMGLTSDPLQERLTSCIRCDLLTVRLWSFTGRPWNTHTCSYFCPWTAVTVSFCSLWIHWADSLQKKTHRICRQWKSVPSWCKQTFHASRHALLFLDLFALFLITLT